MSRDELLKLLLEGKSTRTIAKELGIGKSTVSYWIKKYNLNEYAKHKKHKSNYNFDKIDTKEKAYALGFILADSDITPKNIVEISVEKNDKEIIDFISNIIESNISIDNTFDKEKRRFPRARITIGNKHIIKDVLRYTVGSKENKTFPKIKKELEHYMLLGFFDGDGCLTWGRRKDRNRLWQKVNFTGSYKLLYAIQKLLQKLSITSSLYPKGKENCYVLELASKEDVKKILSYMYGDEDLIILHRKFDKYNALRLELGEFDETTKSTTSSQANDHSLEGVETTGEKMASLNNQLEDPSL